MVSVYTLNIDEFSMIDCGRLKEARSVSQEPFCGLICLLVIFDSIRQFKTNHFHSIKTMKRKRSSCSHTNKQFLKTVQAYDSRTKSLRLLLVLYLSSFIFLSELLLDFSFLAVFLLGLSCYHFFFEISVL